VLVAAGAFLRRGNGSDGPSEGALADAVEIWIAELLATDDRWPLRGRWFDGLAFDQCTRGDGHDLNLSGVVWRVDTQGRVPVRASIRVGDGKIESYDVEVGAEITGERSTLRNVEWLFHFSD
jgi:hypothetical protein